MHEGSLAAGLARAAEAAARAEGARRVVVVRARMPALAHLSPEHLRYHFGLAAAGTLLEGARLEVGPSDGAEELVLESIEIEDGG
jgi:hydrogenase nickel incorporation protein HypA/HybF